MLVRYLVSRGPRGWSVSENGSMIAAGIEKPDAVRMARLSAHAAGAAGGSAALFIENETGVIESVPLDEAH